MSWRYTYCPECGCDRCFTVKAVPDEAVVRGKKIRFIRKDCFCEICGTEVYSKVINDENCDARLAAYGEADPPTKYTVEFTSTVEVEAKDSVEAVEKAQEMFSPDSMYIYVDGNLWG